MNSIRKNLNDSDGKFVKIGSTGYFDQERMEDYPNGVTFVKDKYNRKGMVIKFVVTDKKNNEKFETLETVFQRYTDDDGKIITSGGDKGYWPPLIGGAMTKDEEKDILKLINNEHILKTDWNNNKFEYKLC